MLAVLGDFKNDAPLTAIKNIRIEIQSTDSNDLAEKKYFNQIRVLLQLRDLETQFDEVMESISTFFKEERDLFAKATSLSITEIKKH